MRTTIEKEGDGIDELMKELGKVVVLFLRPENVAIISLLSGLGYKAFDKIIKKLDSQQNDLIAKLDKRLNSLESSTKSANENLEREILRLQILDGMDAKRLSTSEVLYFFDKYKALGGNSFVEEKVGQYVYELNNRGNGNG